MNQLNGFALWITGLPASGKSALARELFARLTSRGIPAAVLESDEMRTILTPEPSYTSEERDRFYTALAVIGAVIVRGGGNVIFDATANRRAYRDHARSLIPRFLEVFVDCPLEVCRARDPKGLFAKAAAGAASALPGVQTPYEAPRAPELVLDCRKPTSLQADAVVTALQERGFISL